MSDIQTSEVDSKLSQRWSMKLCVLRNQKYKRGGRLNAKM
jgi:hypothetical protein